MHIPRRRAEAVIRMVIRLNLPDAVINVSERIDALLIRDGDETSFTSYGDTVVLDANGYNVESYVPGGTKLRLSGTSMASPNVVNLAAKLFALDPSLTPEQAIDLMKRGATTSEDGRRHLIDEKRSVELLQQMKK